MSQAEWIMVQKWMVFFKISLHTSYYIIYSNNLLFYFLLTFCFIAMSDCHDAFISLWLIKARIWWKFKFNKHVNRLKRTDGLVKETYSSATTNTLIEMLMI